MKYGVVKTVSQAKTKPCMSKGLSVQKLLCLSSEATRNGHGEAKGDATKAVRRELGGDDPGERADGKVAVALDESASQ